MTETWTFAVGAILVGLLSGVVGGALLRRIIVSRGSDNRELGDAGRAAALFVFAFMTTVGLVVALASTEPDALDAVPRQVLEYLPRVFAAGLIVIVGRAAAIALAGIATRALADAPVRSRAQLSTVVRHTVTGATLVLAMGQLELDTSILLVVMGTILFTGAGTFVLLVGLGGRGISAEIAAGRYLHRLVRVGDRVVFGEVSGEVTALHAASIEVRGDGDEVVHVPNTVAFASSPRVTRHRPAGPAARLAEEHEVDDDMSDDDMSGEGVSEAPRWVGRAAQRLESSESVPEKSG